MENIITPGLALKAAVPGDDRRGGALTTNNTVSETNKFGVDAVELNPNIEGSMAHDIAEVNSNLANITADGAITSYDIEEGDVYINYTVGADSVRKKLGSSDNTYTLKLVDSNNNDVLTVEEAGVYIVQATGGYSSASEFSTTGEVLFYDRITEGTSTVHGDRFILICKCQIGDEIVRKHMGGYATVVTYFTKEPINNVQMLSSLVLHDQSGSITQTLEKDIKYLCCVITCGDTHNCDITIPVELESFNICKTRVPNRRTCALVSSSVSNVKNIISVSASGYSWNLSFGLILSYTTN